MARNGSGTFVRAHDFTDDAAAAIKIRADRMDEEIDGIATALSASIANDGQTTILADLPMSTHKHTGVGNATARDQYVSVAGLQDGSHNWVAAGGTADAITATYAPALTALVDGQLCFVRASAANATTTPTFASNGLTVHTMTKRGGAAIGIGDIQPDSELILRYKLASTRWEWLNAPVSVSTQQKLSSGTAATYTTPTGCRQLRIRMVGGGGGSAGTATVSGATNGGTGGTTTFNSITAIGGGGSTAANPGANAAGGAGGTGGSGTAFRAPGNAGQSGQVSSGNGAFGGSGGGSLLGGGGRGGNGATAGAANSGGGGSAGNQGNTAGTIAAGGGGGGEYVEFTISSPSATYTYTVGTAGAAGTGDVAGAAGGTGYIIVDELY